MAPAARAPPSLRTQISGWYWHGKQRTWGQYRSYSFSHAQALPHSAEGAPQARSAACRDLAAGYPDKIGGHEKTATSSGAAVYGDHVTTLRCGLPTMLPTTDLRVTADGVDWVPKDSGQGEGDKTITTFGRQPAAGPSSTPKSPSTSLWSNSPPPRRTSPTTTASASTRPTPHTPPPPGTTPPAPDTARRPALRCGAGLCRTAGTGRSPVPRVWRDRDTSTSSELPERFLPNGSFEAPGSGASAPAAVAGCSADEHAEGGRPTTFDGARFTNAAFNYCRAKGGCSAGRGAHSDMIRPRGDAQERGLPNRAALVGRPCREGRVRPRVRRPDAAGTHAADTFRMPGVSARCWHEQCGSAQSAPWNSTDNTAACSRVSCPSFSTIRAT
ncbi:DUF3515 family protein [Streptomyces cyaneofuscatus]|uniref:DUF3515 family protein n=1 Tax=Streptomyces cyaneofuscatus TaxID=66883 RepID=UPI0033B8728C